MRTYLCNYGADETDAMMADIAMMLAYKFELSLETASAAVKKAFEDLERDPASTPFRASRFMNVSIVSIANHVHELYIAK